MKLTVTVLLLALLQGSTYAQPGKRTGLVPHAKNNTQLGKNKFDSLNARRSKNEVAIEIMERKKANSSVKLDDLKNPFDTGKVRTPAVNSTGKQRSKQNNR